MRGMHGLLGLAGLFVSISAWASAVQLTPAESVEVQVDARELPRKLLQARATYRIEPGRCVFYYPRWMPGTHSPMGPVQNLAELYFETPEGQTLAWTRDAVDPYRFSCEIPRDKDHVVVRTRYVCNQPTVNSDGADCFGNALLGVINWNTLLLYPEETPVAQLPVSLELLLPEGWRFGTALPLKKRDGAAVQFETVDLERLVDCPLITGKHFRSIALKAAGVGVPHFLDVVSESESALQIPEELLGRYGRLVAEASALFGRFPFAEYRFLLVLSDEFGPKGLEHLSSSLNGLKERDLADPEKLQPWIATLLPHEYAHAWCGKWRRPQGMVTPDFHSPERTELLWIYEGLTEYLGSVLAARAGLLTAEEYKAYWLTSVRAMLRTKGRRWRPLEDTATASYLQRGGSQYWAYHSRNQDYYFEGEVIWTEADALIRKGTDATRSLDEFCRKFLGAENPSPRVFPYSLEDVVAALNEIHPHDWHGFFAERVKRTQDELPLDVVTLAGYRLQYTPTRSEQQKEAEELWSLRGFAESIGLDVMEDGRIVRVVPERPADRAGLSEGVQILGVGGRKFSLQRMEDAVAGSVAARNVKLLVLEGDVLREVVLEYADGLRYLDLVRDEGHPDRLGVLIQPLAKDDSSGAASPAAAAAATPKP